MELELEGVVVMAEVEQGRGPSSRGQGFTAGSAEASLWSRLPRCGDPRFGFRSPWLSTDILAPGPGHACPEAPLQLCCAGESVQRLWQLIFSFEIRIHVGYFKVWPGIGVGRRGPLGVIWPLGTVFWFFRLFEFQK